MAEENFFSRKTGPLPNYAWLGLGAIGILVYFKSSAGKSQQQQPGLSQAQQQQLEYQQQMAALQAQMAEGQMPTYGSSGAPIYVLPQTSPGVSTPGAPAATTPAATTAPVDVYTAASPIGQETMIGSGYTGTQGAAGGTQNTGSQYNYELTPVTTTAGVTLQPVSSTQWSTYEQSGLPAGESYYYQPTPGTYELAGSGGAAGTPLWLGPTPTST